jgi:hypothetical protein
MNNTQANSDPDQLDTPKDCAAWLGLGYRAFLANVRQRKIPAVRINNRVLRFHRPSVLAALQKGGAQ